MSGIFECAVKSKSLQHLRRFESLNEAEVLRMESEDWAFPSMKYPVLGVYSRLVNVKRNLNQSVLE